VKATRLLHCALLLAPMCSLACGTAEETPLVEAGLIEGVPVSVQDQATVSLGVLEGDSLQEFYLVVTPFLLPDGRVAVPLRSTNSIRLFSESGEYIGTFGREGQGPGEMTGLSSAWARGDTIEAFDGRQKRITRFMPDGSVDVVQIEAVPSAQGVVPGDAPNRWLFFGVASGGPDERDRWAFHWFDRQGSHVTEIVQVGGFVRQLESDGNSTLHPLSPKAFFAFHNGQAYVNESLTPSIQVFDSLGSLLREVQWTAPEATFGDVLQAVREKALARASADALPEVRYRFETASALEPSVVWGIIVDELGYVWIRPYDPLIHAAALGGMAGPKPGGLWRVFSPDGIELASVAMPDDLEPVQITATHVLGLARSELGVESVRVHTLTRR
jgi:hypothetical protein